MFSLPKAPLRLGGSTLSPSIARQLRSPLLRAARSQQRLSWRKTQGRDYRERVEDLWQYRLAGFFRATAPFDPLDWGPNQWKWKQLLLFSADFPACLARSAQSLTFIDPTAAVSVFTSYGWRSLTDPCFAFYIISDAVPTILWSFSGGAINIQRHRITFWVRVINVMEPPILVCIFRGPSLSIIQNPPEWCNCSINGGVFVVKRPQVAEELCFFGVKVFEGMRSQHVSSQVVFECALIAKVPSLTYLLCNMYLKKTYLINKQIYK